MLVRIVVLSVILSALAVAAPVLAPDLLASLRPAERMAAVSEAPSTRRPPAAPDRQSHDGLRQVVLGADAAGHFVAEATIDGHQVAVMVDTGSTMVALSGATARRLDLHPAASAYSERIATANGVIMAARVDLAEVRLGNVSLHGVAAIIVPGKALPIDLLGMSFLGRMSRFEIAGGHLVLSQ